VYFTFNFFFPHAGWHQGITEAVLLDDDPILGWHAHTIGLENVAGLKPASFEKILPANRELEIITTKIKRTPRLILPFGKNS